MTRPFALAAAAVLFVLLATANAGGYRYGVSDQAFYIPAVSRALDPSLFPRDRALLEPQQRFWPAGSILAAGVRMMGGRMPLLFLIVYLVTLLALFAAAVAFSRTLGATWCTTAAFLLLATFRHQIARTGANSLESYMHPRMLAFALGAAALAAFATNRVAWAVVLVAFGAGVHVSTAFWFAVALAGAWVWTTTWRRPAILAATGLVVLALVVVGGGVAGAWPIPLTVMDPPWVAALGDRPYLFPASWPLSAWLINLAYPVVIVGIHRRRSTLGVAVPQEAAMVAGLVGLAVLFLASVPLTAWHLAIAVQAQVNRVFWLLDFTAAFFIAWWISAAIGSSGRRVSIVAIAVLGLVSAVRGFYVTRIEADRALVSVGLPRNDWTDAMSWIQRQPSSWLVLANPNHAFLYGPGVRVAALRDTVLEASKDGAIAMYDRASALRVDARIRALASFDSMTTADIRALDATYGIDVLVERADRPFDFPVLYRNDQFVVYGVR